MKQVDRIRAAMRKLPPKQFIAAIAKEAGISSGTVASYMDQMVFKKREVIREGTRGSFQYTLVEPGQGHYESHRPGADKSAPAGGGRTPSELARADKRYPASAPIRPILQPDGGLHVWWPDDTFVPFTPEQVAALRPFINQQQP